MNFYGFLKYTLIDYPGEVAATLFTSGCNFICPYCHNPELINNKDSLNQIDNNEIFDYLNKRKNLLGGVCITGGEPLLNDEIIDVIDEIKEIGLKVKIDTNGSFPEILKKLNVDYIAMDIKTSLDKYQLVYNGNIDKLKMSLKESIDYIIKSGIDHEFRTTVVPYIIDKNDLNEVLKFLEGAKNYNLAQFRPDKTLLPDWQEIEPYPLKYLEEMKEMIEMNNIFSMIRKNY